MSTTHAFDVTEGVATEDQGTWPVWRVEGDDPQSPDGRYVATFHGDRAEAQARHWAAVLTQDGLPSDVLDRDIMLFAAIHEAGQAA